MRKYIGVPPKIGENILSFDGYDLWVTGRRGDWLEIKLISQKPRSKGNWNLLHNGERFSENKCYKKMCEYEISLKRELTRKVVENFDYMFGEGARLQREKKRKGA